MTILSRWGRLRLIESISQHKNYKPSVYHFTANFIRVVFPFAEGFLESLQVSEKVRTPQATEQADKLIKFCTTPKSTKEMMDYLGLKHRPHFLYNILQPLVESGQLRLTLPDKPSSPKQKYITVQTRENKDG